MTLAELAFASFVFSRIDSGAYQRLLRETGECVDLSRLDHGLAVIRWLNAWNVRIPGTCHNTLSEQLKLWYESNQLFDHSLNLHELNDAVLDSIRAPYKNLMQVECVGPTAAAKILFAVRPKSLMPWDEPIRRELQYSERPRSYVKFLKSVRSKIQKVGELCKEHEFELTDLPNILGRPNSTIPKLIDEYLWVTITKRCRPSKADFQRWAEWS